MEVRTVSHNPCVSYRVLGFHVLLAEGGKMLNHDQPMQQLQ